MDEFFLEIARNAESPEIGGFLEDVEFAQANGQSLRLDISIPQNSGPFPIVIYVHGGGYVYGSSKIYKHVCDRFAAAGNLVFSTNYRLAPENPFPAGFDDCLAATTWILKHAAGYSGDTARVAIAGDSAGGNFAAGVAACLGQQGPNPISKLLLAYPTLLPPHDDDWGALGSVPRMLREAYVGPNDEEAMRADWRYNPILAAESLPPSCVVCGTRDPLMTDATTLANALRTLGTECKEIYIDEMPHGFMQMSTIFSEANSAIDQQVDFLATNLQSAAMSSYDNSRAQ